MHKLLLQYKLDLVKEWEVQSIDLTYENFYKKNYKNLEELNNYVKYEVSLVDPYKFINDNKKN
jgi:hypothetical protein